MVKEPESAEPYKEFIREMTARIERALQAFAAEMREDRRFWHDESRRYFVAIEAGQREILDDTRELRAESRTQTQALLRMLDRLDGGEAAAG